MTDEDVAAFFDGRTVLVTGGMGFIGSTVARALVELGAKVTVADNLDARYGGNRFNLAGVEDRLRVAVVDQGNEEAMRPLVRGVDCVFNLVGQVSHVDSMASPLQDLYTNVTTHVALLEACRRESPRAKVVFAGTRGQYGRPLTQPVDEAAPILPRDANGVNKHAGEMYHFLYERVHGLRACSLRLTNTYGPRHTMKTARQGVFAWFVRQALDGETIRLYGGGDQLRDFNFVDDVAAALLRAMASPAADGEVFNLGSPEPVNLKHLTGLIVASAGSGSVAPVPFPEALKPIEIGDYAGDFRKIERLLGWRPRVTLEEGVRRTVEYYREHRRHYWSPEVYP